MLDILSRQMNNVSRLVMLCVCIIDGRPGAMTTITVAEDVQGPVSGPERERDHLWLSPSSADQWRTVSVTALSSAHSSPDLRHDPRPRPPPAPRPQETLPAQAAGWPRRRRTPGRW